MDFSVLSEIKLDTYAVENYRPLSVQVSRFEVLRALGILIAVGHVWLIAWSEV